MPGRRRRPGEVSPWSTILNANELGPELARVTEELGRHYSLGFVPSHQGDARLHRLDVEVAGRGLQVRHREVYWDQPFRERPADRTFGTLLLGGEHNRFYVVLAGQRSDGELLPVRGRAFELPATEPNGGPHAISIVVDLSPGSYYLAVGVVDLLGSEASYVRRELEVTPPGFSP